MAASKSVSRKSATKKAAKTRKPRGAAKKASKTRKQQTAGRKAAATRKRPAAAQKASAAAKMRAAVAPTSTAMAEIDGRIAVVRANLRELVEQAASYSGAGSEELLSQRISDQEAKLALLMKQREELSSRT